MNRENLLKIFCDDINKLSKNSQWLKKSYEKSKKIDFNDIKEEDYEALEALSNRFGRTVDILINKVLRGLDLIELEDVSRKLDIVIRAEKRKFVDDYKILIGLKDLRNELAHEYIDEELVEKFKEVLNMTPILFEILDKVLNYVKEKGYCK